MEATDRPSHDSVHVHGDATCRSGLGLAPIDMRIREARSLLGLYTGGKVTE